VRCSSHPLAAALARRCEAEGIGPITATSLNRSHSPPALTIAEARAILSDDPNGPRLIDVEGAEAGGDAESTVVDVSGEQPRVLRWGAVPAAELDPVMREIALT
jgi:tRNA A37 threonylcarbamoyladenosine synthetase subunit TsaC/SUA5/YrdC